MSDEILVNGIDARTGLYLSGPTTDAELARRTRWEPLSAERLNNYLWLAEEYDPEDTERVLDGNPRRLTSAGWAVIFAPNVSPDERAALKPLLDHREKQAGTRCKVYEYVPGRSVDDFLSSEGARPGPVDPRIVPYYVLIVGNPQTIPFRFQHELDVQYAVGRIWFRTVEEYKQYAASVVRAETGPPARPQRMTFFGVANEDDRATQRTCDDLVVPLGTASKNKSGWEVREHNGPKATKAQLGRVLGGGEETPALLFTASHGMKFPLGDPEQLDAQGALLCQDWPGPEKWKGAIPKDFYFAAADVPEEADLTGLLAFCFACFSGGTPEIDNFGGESEDALNDPERIAEHPFIARLPQQLLSNPGGGALAVVCHVDRAWTTSFSWSQKSQVQLFAGMLRRLRKGYPLGSAMEHFNLCHAELAARLSGLWEDRFAELDVSRARFGRLWRANNDARNFVVFGDPAVRLPEAWTRRTKDVEKSEDEKEGGPL